MLVVLEGCDGTGKTTLANNLASILNAEVIHCNRYTPNDYTFFHDIIEASKERNIIADRFCYGQFVYQKESERPLSIRGEEFREVKIGNDTYRFDNKVSALRALHILETEMLRAGATVVHVTAPVEEIKDRLEARKEYLINDLTVEEVIKRFKGVFELSILSVKEWNTGEFIER